MVDTLKIFLNSVLPVSGVPMQVLIAYHYWVFELLKMVCL